MISSPGFKPRLAILTNVLRADFHNMLSHFKRFEVWHLYERCAPDISPDELAEVRTVRFRNSIDLLLKLIKLKPALIQGGEPYDFPTQIPLIFATIIGSLILGVPYYFPTFENIPPEIKFARIYRFGIPLSPLLIPFVKSVARIYAQRATLIFAVNEGARKNMASLNCPEGKISKLLYATWGVDTELFTPRTDGNEPDMGANAILFVGRLVEQKGIIVLLEAFVKVKEQIPDAQLFIIGDGPLKEKITQIANAKNITDSIHLLGMILNQHLPPYFRAARVTVTPSITTQRWAEQVGMVNIQSIACGTPVISTRSGSIPEFMSDGLTAILVPERNPEALANAIIRVLSDEKLRTYLSQNCRSIAEEHYDARKNIIRVENLLWNCLFGEKNTL